MKTEQPGAQGDGGAEGRPEFPSARYFQIHFEYLQSLLDETKRSLDALKEEVAQAQHRANAAHETAVPVPPTPQIVIAQTLSLRGDAPAKNQDSKRSPKLPNLDQMSER
jgi:hypothetical protein